MRRFAAGRLVLAGLVVVGFAGCAPVAAPMHNPDPVARPPAAIAYAPALSPQAAAHNFVTVVERVEPVAEALCRARTRGIPCDLRIVVDDRPNQPPNAYQTLDSAGQPIVAFTVSLIADARNADELAFVLGHEASHHFLGHIPRQQDTAMTGALLAGVLASISGADPATVRSVQDIGATVGARTFSKDFELEADALGAEIAWRAGFDPIRGAQFFSRLPDPGDRFLGSHPPNAQRVEQVRRTVAGLR
ncbi:MAG: M48 family metallopeptidase [Paracoccaceae bacterium]|nr:M48 family metallopeptidase [Paracoccaceae bacterium]